MNDERSFFVGDDEDGYWGAYAPWTAWDAASNLTYSLTPSAGDSIRFALPGGLHNGVIDNVRITQMSYADTLFVWGLDLSQSWQGAGGVGGLVAQVSGGSGAAAYYPTYDGNGNISEYLDDTGAIQAHYRYDPFGNTTTATGTMANHFAYRFSTKPWDEGAGGYYYGYRFYHPELGRWLNRDPIEEEGGINLYGFVGNGPINNVDLLGQDWLSFVACFVGLSASEQAALRGNVSSEMLKDPKVAKEVSDEIARQKKIYGTSWKAVRNQVIRDIRKDATEKAIGKMGRKAFLKWLGQSAAGRAVPYVGQALLVWDACKFLYCSPQFFK